MLLTPRAPSTAAERAARLIEAMLVIVSGELGVLGRPTRRNLVGLLAKVGAEREDRPAAPGKLFQVVVEWSWS
jgi:hypothetical protein